jgi:ankyrin repeat protein
MPSTTTQDWMQKCLGFICDHVEWNILNTLCQDNPDNSTTFPIELPLQKPTTLATDTQILLMALGSSDSLLTKLNQPATFFTIACVSISLLALSTAWKNRKPSSPRPLLRRSEPEAHPEIVITDEGYSSSGERTAEDISSKISTKPSLFTRTAALLDRCSTLLQVANTTPAREENQAIIMSSLSAELPMSIAALCQIQQLLGIYYDVFNTQPGLQSCYETVLTGLAFVVSTLDGELATLTRCDCSEQNFPRTSSSSHQQFEQLIQQLGDHRQSLMFVIDSAQKASESHAASSSLTVAAPVDSKAHTPGTDLKGFMDSPPDFDELPEYSPPTNGQPIIPHAKAPSSDAVEIDSQPVHLKPNSSITVTTTDLFTAVAEDNSTELESLLSTGFDPNSTHGKLQRTALHEAARLNRPACAQILLHRGALVDIDDSKGDAPLHLASWEGNVETASLLLKADADIDRLSGRDGYSPLWCAITGQHIDLVRLLLRKGARVSLKSPADALPLHQAGIMGQSAMCQLLIESGANVDCKDREQNTPLHYAATTGDLRTAKVLINEGADVNAKQERGLTPLHWAAHKGHEDMVKLLLDSQAGMNALSETFATPLHCAAAKGHLRCAKALVRRGADCKIVTSGWDSATGTAEEMALLKGFASVATFITDFKGKRR